MSTHVQKVIVRFGRRLQATDPNGAWAGMPSDLYSRGAQSIGLASVHNERDETAQVVNTPHSVTRGSIRAIAIAPDSPIEAVDIKIEGQNLAHRVAVGAPFIGDIPENSYIYVTPVRSLPLLYRMPGSVPTFVQYRDWVMPWEMTAVEKIPAGTFGLAIDAAAPQPLAKLNLYRGDLAHLAAIAKRAPYTAEMDWKLAVYTAGAPDLLYQPTLFMIVDGRRRFRVVANRQSIANGGAPASLKVWGVESYKTTSGMNPAISSRLVDAPTFDELLAATAIPDDENTPLVFDYTPQSGNPYFAVCARIIANDFVLDANKGPTSTNALGHLRIEAWDE